MEFGFIAVSFVVVVVCLPVVGTRVVASVTSWVGRPGSIEAAGAFSRRCVPGSMGR